MKYFSEYDEHPASILKINRTVQRWLSHGVTLKACFQHKSLPWLFII